MPNSATPRILELLAEADLFGTLPAKERAAFAACFRQARYSRGEILFARGDPGSNIFVLAEGQVRLAIASSEGRELSFEVVGPGNVFGEIAVLDGRSRSAEATALTPVTAYALGRGDFNRIRSEHAAMSDAVISILCGRLREVSDKLEMLALYPLDVRLAKFLLNAIGERKALPGRRVPVDLRYSQGELALLLGASRPKVNAALCALEKTGAIRRTADRMYCDAEKLSSIAPPFEARPD